jgi:hypothetical protein
MALYPTILRRRLRVLVVQEPARKVSIQSWLAGAGHNAAFTA